jgi:3-deoxy-manno-octulosonate cytidylyltransferase (CMP-KDO synthetase)
MENVTCVIPARLSSSRFPGKPLYIIEGREMILRVCDIASKCRKIDEVIVATEDQKIYDVVSQAGYHAIITPPQDTCTHRVSWVASNYLDCDYVVNLQGDEPCINPNWVDDMIDFTIFHEKKCVQSIYEVSKEDIRDEDCVKAVVNNGNIIYLTRVPEVYTKSLYGIAGLYVYDIETIRKFVHLDMTMVDAWKGLDTFGFIGNTDVSAYQIQNRPHAVDRLTDIPKVIESL